MRRLLYGAAVIVATLSSAAIAALMLAPAPGHTALHIGCTSHNHGLPRTAGEGRRLLDARALNRQARQPE